MLIPVLKNIKRDYVILLNCISITIVARYQYIWSSLNILLGQGWCKQALMAIWGDSFSIVLLGYQMIELIFVFLLSWVSCFWLRGAVIRSTEQASFWARVPARSLFTTLCFGIGIIGGEGFGLPGPILGALIFYNGSKFYLYTAVVPFIFWLALAFAFHAKGYLLDREARTETGSA